MGMIQINVYNHSVTSYTHQRTRGSKSTSSVPPRWRLAEASIRSSSSLSSRRFSVDGPCASRSILPALRFLRDVEKNFLASKANFFFEAIMTEHILWTGVRCYLQCILLINFFFKILVYSTLRYNTCPFHKKIFIGIRISLFPIQFFIRYSHVFQ